MSEWKKIGEIHHPSSDYHNPDEEKAIKPKKGAHLGDMLQHSKTGKIDYHNFHNGYHPEDAHTYQSDASKRHHDSTDHAIKDFKENFHSDLMNDGSEDHEAKHESSKINYKPLSSSVDRLKAVSKKYKK